MQRLAKKTIAFIGWYLFLKPCEWAYFLLVWLSGERVDPELKALLKSLDRQFIKLLKGGSIQMKMQTIKCNHCDATMEAPDDGWLYSVRHIELGETIHHDLALLVKAVISVKEYESND